MHKTTHVWAVYRHCSIRTNCFKVEVVYPNGVRPKRVLISLCPCKCLSWINYLVLTTQKLQITWTLQPIHITCINVDILLTFFHVFSMVSCENCLNISSLFLSLLNCSICSHVYVWSNIVIIACWRLLSTFFCITETLITTTNVAISCIFTLLWYTNNL